MLILALGLIGGFTFSLGLAFFVNYLDDFIKGQDDVETYLGLPFLVTFPTLKPTASSSGIFRRISTPLRVG